MRNILILTICLVLTGTLAAQEKATLSQKDKVGINWLTWEEAQEKMAEEPKSMFVDMYTSWCGWCKKMDASTFKDKEVVDYLNENFYAVKFNAEQKESITYQGFEFKFVNSGRRGYHQLAHSMLNGRMGYPAFVYFNEAMERIMISPGYKKPEQIIPELEFANTGKYKEMDLEQYKKSRA